MTEKTLDVLADYKQVTAIHVYSLAPHPQKDLSLLSDVSAQLSEYSINEDTSAAAKKYGTIPNTQVRRRDRKERSKAAAPPSKPVKQEPVAPKPTPAAKIKQDPFAPKPSPTDTKPVKQEESEPSSKNATPSSSAGKKPPALKKGVSGGIMQSFARAAALPPRPKPAPKKEEDTEMALSDDGEADDSDLPAKKATADPEAVRAARKEREDALRRMMEDDDDEEDAEASEKDDEPADEEMEEAPEPEPEPEPEAKKEEKESAEVVSSSGDGRRRGKRRVMKKKRILDDQGYMGKSTRSTPLPLLLVKFSVLLTPFTVTIQEPGWESFSEDEAAPPAKKQAVTVTQTQTQTQSSTPSSSAGKAKKPAGKGQGNIMSFFAKK